LDLDGTLVDTNYHHALAWFRAFRQHGVLLPVWRIHRHIGMGGDQLVAALAGDAVEEELGDDVRAAEKALYLALIEETEPLEAAARAGLETACVLTGGFAEQELRDAGAAEVYESVQELRARLGDSRLV